MNNKEANELPALLSAIRDNVPGAAEQLYGLMARGLRLVLGRHVKAQDVGDQLQEVFIELLVAIRKGQIHEPQALAGFARTIAVRKSAAYIDSLMHQRAREAGIEDKSLSLASRERMPDLLYQDHQEMKVSRQVLQQLPECQREVLVRFYIKEQTKEQICSDMNLSPDQFRLLKSRAKQRFGELGRRYMTRKPMLSQVLGSSFSSLCA